MTANKKGILTVFGCCMAIFWPGALTFGFPGVMAPLWQEMFHVGRGAAGNILFFMLAAVGIFMFLVGRWQERYGTRKMITVGVVLSSSSLLAAAFASNMTAVYAWAALTGLSSSFVYVPALTTVQRWYPKKKGLVTGIVSMVFGLSAAIMSPLFGRMLISLGYETMSLCILAISLPMGLAGAYLARAPEMAAVVPLAARCLEEKAEMDAPQSFATADRSLTLQESLHTRSFWFLWITWALQGAAGVAMVTLSTAYGLSRGFALEWAVLILTAFNLTNGLGRLASGILSDAFGRNQVMSAAFLGAGFAYFLLPAASSLIACVFLAAVVGFAFGSLFAVSAPLVADCFGLKHFGAIFGLAFVAYGFVAGPLGPSLSGYMLDATGDDFFPVFLYLGIFCIISGLCIRKVVPPLNPDAE